MDRSNRTANARADRVAAPTASSPAPRQFAFTAAARLRRMTRTLARAIESALLPPLCCLCGAPGQPRALDLCDVCATFLPVVDEPCRPGWEPGDAFEAGTVLRTLCLFKYQYPVDHFVRSLKFRGDRLYARVLGELMGRARLRLSGELPACVVPIPLHSQRLRTRGFNQAREIAKYAAEVLGIGVERQLLKRKSATREQSGLSVEERLLNVRGAFEVVGPLPPGRIALLDDVLTTGSTMSVAADALCRAGARELEIWAVARVEREDQRGDRMPDSRSAR